MTEISVLQIAHAMEDKSYIGCHAEDYGEYLMNRGWWYHLPKNSYRRFK